MAERNKLSSKQQNFHEGGNFDHNSPRPPIPGEEKSHCMSDWVSQSSTMDWMRKYKSSSPIPRKSHNNGKAETMVYVLEKNIGVLLVADFGCDSDRQNVAHECHHCDSTNNSPPPRLRWAQSLSLLLKDEEGVKLFKEYLETEGLTLHLKALDFWFACEGLRTQMNRDIIHQIIKAIYRKFFVKFALPINEELRKQISINVAEITSQSQCLDTLPVTVFDEAQTQIEHFINKTTYPNFLKSEMYLQCLEVRQ